MESGVTHEKALGRVVIRKCKANHFSEGDIISRGLDNVAGPKLIIHHVLMEKSADSPTDKISESLI